jgi:hypothetical protein
MVDGLVGSVFFAIGWAMLSKYICQFKACSHFLWPFNYVSMARKSLNKLGYHLTTAKRFRFNGKNTRRGCASENRSVVFTISKINQSQPCGGWVARG